MLKAWLIFELSFVVVIFMILATQVAAPWLLGRPIFPILRRRVVRAESDLASAREDADLTEQERRASKIRRRIAEL